MGRPQLTLVDPATLALHEIAEPARLRTLIRGMRTRRIQDAPVLLTDEPSGLLVLDGVHRTKALISLGVPRMLCLVIPRDQIGNPGGWTHLIDLPGETEEIRRRMQAADELRLTPDLAAGSRVVAQVVTEGEALSVQATRPGRSGLAAAYHALAQTYATLPYLRQRTPHAPAAAELQVRWVAPTLAAVENLVAEYGALPAGVTRFDLPGGSGVGAAPVGGVGLDRLQRAVDPDQGRRLLAELRDGGDRWA